jgi:hypothetical protein
MAHPLYIHTYNIKIGPEGMGYEAVDEFNWLRIHFNDTIL